MSKSKVGTKTERRNKAVVLLVAVMMLAVCVASVMPSFNNDNTNNDESFGAGFVAPKFPRPAGSGEIEITYIDELALIGNDPEYPLSGKYLLMQDLNFKNVTSYTNSTAMTDYLDSLGWKIEVEVTVDASHNVTFTIKSDVNGGALQPLDASIQYMFGGATSGTSNAALSHGSLTIPASESGFDGTTPMAFLIGGSADGISSDAEFAFSIFVSGNATEESYHMGNFVPIGVGTAFTGNFDGNGYAIMGMETTFVNLTSTVDNVNLSTGMFAQISGAARISNLVLEDGSATSAMVKLSNTVSTDDASFVGGIVGYVAGTATVNNCSTSRIVISSTGAGGIVGSTGAVGATVSNSTNTGSVTAYGTTGAGIVGVANSPISNCYNTGSVTAPIYAAGIVAVLESGASVDSCNNGGTVTITDSASVFIGGVVGRAYANISNVYNSGRIKGVTSAGGIIGMLEAGYSVSSARNSGEVTAAVNVGGIVGHSYSEVSKSINYGIITSPGDNVGGIVGKAETTTALISNSLNYGPITGNNNVGGIVGNAEAPINASLNYGAVKALDAVGIAGGVAGITSSSASVTDCGNYYRIVTAPAFAGGIVGSAQAEILRPGNYGTVISAGVAGGIVGTTSAKISHAMNKSVDASFISGTIVVGDSATYIKGNVAGGIAGTVAPGVTITGGANHGHIKESTTAGGILGKTPTSGIVTIDNSYSVGTFANIATSAGGILGYVDGDVAIRYVYSTFNSTGGASNNGGIIGNGTPTTSTTLTETYSITVLRVSPDGYTPNANVIQTANFTTRSTYLGAEWNDWEFDTNNGGMPYDGVMTTYSKVTPSDVQLHQHIFHEGYFSPNYVEWASGIGGAFVEYDWHVSFNDAHGAFATDFEANPARANSNEVIDEYSYSPILFDNQGDAGRSSHLWFKCEITPAIPNANVIYTDPYLHAAYYGLTIEGDSDIMAPYDIKYSLTGATPANPYTVGQRILLREVGPASADQTDARDHANLQVNVISLDPTEQRFVLWEGPTAPGGGVATKLWDIGPWDVSSSPAPKSYHSNQDLIIKMENRFRVSYDADTTVQFGINSNPVTTTYVNDTTPQEIWLKTSDSITVKATTTTPNYAFRGWDGENPESDTAVYKIATSTKAVANSSPSLTFTTNGKNELKIDGDAVPFESISVTVPGNPSTEYTFQWMQSYNTGNTWTPIDGATGTSYSPTPTTGMGTIYYKCVVTQVDANDSLPALSKDSTVYYKGMFYGLIVLDSDRSIGSGSTEVKFEYSLNGTSGWNALPSGGAPITSSNLHVRAINLSTNGAGVVQWTSADAVTSAPGKTSDANKNNVTTWQYGALSSNITIQAELGYMVTFGSSGGSISGTIGGTPVTSPVPLGIGQTLDLTATPSPGYRFDGWTGAVTSVAGNTAIVSGTGLSSATTIGATFTEQINITQDLLTGLQKKFIKDPNQLEVTLSNDTGILYQWQKRVKGTSAWDDITVNGDDRLLNLEPTAAGVQYEYQCVMTKADGTVPLISKTATVAMYNELMMGADYAHVTGSLQYQFLGDEVRNYTGRTMLEFNNLAVTSVDVIFNNANDLKFIEWASGPDTARWTKAISGDTYVEAKTGYTISWATPSNGTVVAKIGTDTQTSSIILGKGQIIDFVATPDAGWKFNNWTDLTGSATTSLSGNAVTGPMNIVANFTNHLGFATDLPGGLQKMFIGDDNKLEVVLIDSTDVDYQWFSRKAGTTIWIPIGENSSILTLPNKPAGEQWEYYCETSKDDGTVPLDSSTAVVAMFYGLTIVDPDHQAAAEAGSLQYQFMSDTTGLIMVPVENYLGGKVMLENGGYAVTSLRVIFDNTAGDLQFIKWGNGSTDVVYPFASVTDDITVNVKSGYRVFSALYSHGDVTAKLNGVTLSMPFDLVIGADDILELTAVPTAGGYMPDWVGAMPAGVGVAIVDGSTLTAELEVDPNFTKVLTVVIDDSGVTGEEMGTPQTLKANATNTSGNPDTAYQWYVKDKDGNWKMIDGATTDTLIITEQDAGKVDYRCEVSALGVKPLDSDPATVALYRVLTLPTIPAADGKMQYRLAGGAWVDYTAPVLLKDAAGEPITDVSVQIIGMPEGKGIAQWAAGTEKTDVQVFDFTVSDDLLDASGNISVGVKLGFGVTIDVGEGGHIEYSRDGGETYQVYNDGDVVYVGVDDVIFKAVGDETYDFDDWLNIEGFANATVDGDLITISNVTEPLTFGVEFERAYRLLPFLVLFVTVVSAMIAGFALIKKKSDA